MRNATYAALAFTLALGSVQAPARAAVEQPAKQGGQTRGATGAVAPEAMAALDRMGAFLRTLRGFQVKAAISSEDVLDDGQKVQLDSSVDMIAKRPDQLRVEVTNDRQERYFLYDGRSFTLWAPRANYYATVPAPSTINELVGQLEAKYSIELPLVDLFRWGTPDSDATTITVAKDIGPSAVEGTTCEQYAFRQPGLDWQIWIQAGDFPLPRKVVLTTTTDDARPQYSAVYTWNLAPSFDASAFTFVPPAGARRIVIQEAVPGRVGSNR
jgi:hypothetical protein